MVYVVMIFVGFFLMFGGVLLLEENRWDFNKRNLYGFLCMVVGAFLLIVGLYMTRPIEAQATGLSLSEIVSEESIELGGKDLYHVCDYPIAGVTQQMSLIEYQVMSEKALSVTEDDIDLLARLMTAEQGYGAEERCYYLTGSVVINRMNNEKFPDSLREVVYQTGQYQCVQNGHIEREYDEIAWEVAEELLVYGTFIPENVIFQAEFTQGSGVYEQIGRTYFCYE